MPDITMCDNDNCPKKHSCYRSTAVTKPGMRQSMAKFEVDKGYTLSDGWVFSCSYYWPLDKEAHL